MSQNQAFLKGFQELEEQQSTQPVETQPKKQFTKSEFAIENKGQLNFQKQSRPVNFQNNSQDITKTQKLYMTKQQLQQKIAHERWIQQTQLNKALHQPQYSSSQNLMSGANQALYRPSSPGYSASSMQDKKTFHHSTTQSITSQNLQTHSSGRLQQRLSINPLSEQRKQQLMTYKQQQTIQTPRSVQSVVSSQIPIFRQGQLKQQYMHSQLPLQRQKPQLQNIVSTANLCCSLDLRQIALKSRNAEYNPKRFAAVIMRIRQPKTTALIFQSGKIVCTGAKSEQQSKTASMKYAKIIKCVGFDVKFKQFKVQNIVASCSVPFAIRLQILASEHKKFASYQPQIFPGLIYRMYMPKVVLLIFVSGKVVLTGAKTRQQIEKAFDNIVPVLQENRKPK